MKIPVDGHLGLYRDDSSGAIVNCNNNEYEQYVKLKTMKMAEKNEIKSLKLEIEHLKNLLNKVIKENL